MGGKVIKINLFGIICTMILIIASIVGIVIFATRDKDGSKSSNKKDDKQNVVQDDKNDYKELNKKEFVTINGATKEITMKTYEKRGEYKIDYDIDNFYINEHAPDGGIFIESQVSESIIMKICRKDNFKSKSNDLIVNEANNKKTDKTYALNTRDFKGHLCYIESKETDADVTKTYYMENGDEYYQIDVKCGKSYTNNIMPIIEKMIDSFSIM